MSENILKLRREYRQETNPILKIQAGERYAAALEAAKDLAKSEEAALAKGSNYRNPKVVRMMSDLGRMTENIDAWREDLEGNGEEVGDIQGHEFLDAVGMLEEALSRAKEYFDMDQDGDSDVDFNEEPETNPIDRPRTSWSGDRPASEGRDED